MFDTLSSSLSNAFKSLNADAKLSAENMKVRQRYQPLPTALQHWAVLASFLLPDWLV
jgi:hypothetical protein